jgi:hypothetical protein
LTQNNLRRVGVYVGWGVHKRRSYDRSLASSSSSTITSATAAHPHQHHSHNYASTNEARRRSANYAWDRRHHHHPPPPGSKPHAYTYTAQRAQPSSGDPHVRRATGTSPHYYRPPRTGWKETELDRVNRVSGLGRAVQLVGLFIAVAVVGTLGKS